MVSSKLTEIKPGWKLEERANDIFFVLLDRRIAVGRMAAGFRLFTDTK